jgi:NAD+ kinase
LPCVAATSGGRSKRSHRSRVDIFMDHAVAMHMLFDPGHSLDERILSEQFGY